MHLEYHDSGRTVSAVILFKVTEKQPSVLLAKRLTGAYAGLLHPPGGFVEDGETAREAAVRELLEEAVIVLTLEQLLVSHVSRFYMHIYDTETELRHRFMPFHVALWQPSMGHPQRTNPQLLGRWEWVPMDRRGTKLLDSRVPPNVQTVAWVANRIRLGLPARPR